MGAEVDRFFDNLERKAEHLSKTAGNEAMQYNLIIRPFLTSALTLGWTSAGIAPQTASTLQEEIIPSNLGHGAIQKNLSPNVLIVPFGIPKDVALAVLNARIRGLKDLFRNLLMVKEYQYVHSAVWSLIIDGNKWVLQKNNKTCMTFNSLGELKKGLDDFRDCISLEAIVKRMIRFGTIDLLIVRPSSAIIVIASPERAYPPEAMSDFITDAKITSRDLILNLCKTFQIDADNWKNSHSENVFLTQALEKMQGALADLTMVISETINFRLVYKNFWNDTRKKRLNELAGRITRWYSEIVYLSHSFKSGRLEAQKLIDACDRMQDEDRYEIQQLRQLALAETASNMRL